MSTPTKIKAVLFDMDGVLIEAKEWHYEALNKALSLFGFAISLDEHLLYFDGLPTRVKLQMLTQNKGLPLALHDFISQMKQIFTIRIIQEKCVPNFIHEYALSSLKSEGYHLALCSNSIKNTVDLMMELSYLKPYLEFMLSNEDVSQPKPHPEIYLQAIKRLNLSPKECLIVEDNENGVKAARASGAHCLVVKEIEDTNYQNIKNYIQMIEGQGGAIQ